MLSFFCNFCEYITQNLMFYSNESFEVHTHTTHEIIESFYVGSTCSTKFLVQLLGRWVLWKYGSFGIVRGLLPRDNVLEGVKALTWDMAEAPFSWSFRTLFSFEISADVSCITVSCWPCRKHGTMGDLAFLRLAVFTCVALDLSGVILDFLNLTFPSEVLLLFVPLSFCKLSDMKWFQNLLSFPSQVTGKKWNILTN